MDNSLGRNDGSAPVHKNLKQNKKYHYFRLTIYWVLYGIKIAVLSDSVTYKCL